MPELFQKTTSPKAFFPWKTVILAIAALAIVGTVLVHFTYHRTNAEVTLAQLKTYPSHIVFKHTFGVVGHDETEDDFYVIATLRIKSTVPATISLDGVKGTLTLADGSTLDATAIEKAELPNLYGTFPAIKPLTATPLEREASIAPGESTEGMVILHYPVDQKTWDARKSSTLSVALYRQKPIIINLPK